MKPKVGIISAGALGTALAQSISKTMITFYYGAGTLN